MPPVIAVDSPTKALPPSTDPSLGGYGAASVATIALPAGGIPKRGPLDDDDDEDGDSWSRGGDDDDDDDDEDDDLDDEEEDAGDASRAL